jgi:integrase
MDKDKNSEEFDYLADIKPFLMALYDPSPATGKPRSQTTINRYGDYLDAIFNYGIKTGMITKNPVKGRTKPKEKPRAVQLTVADIEKIMAVAQEHVKWAIEVCFNLGTRSGESELLALKWENVKFDKSEVLIYGRKTKEYRVVPVTNGFLKKLEEMRAKAQTDCIIEYRGKPITNLRKGFRNACKKAGITYPVRFYDLRHLFATTMLANGADLAAVSKLMGHSRVTMTADVYYQYLQGEKERAVSLLPVLKTA